MKYFLIMLVILSIYSCNDYPKQVDIYGQGFDIKRKELKIPLTPNGKEYSVEYGLDYCVWKNNKKEFPCFFCKIVFWDSTGIYKDINVFFKERESENSERLKITYVSPFMSPGDTSGIFHRYEWHEKGIDTLINTVSADSILKNWGLFNTAFSYY